MIAKGNTHDSGPKLVSYILAAQEGERVEFGGARGFDFFSADVHQAAAIMQQIADHTTNCRDAWFHTQTRLAPGEQLSRKHWERVLDREEKRLGFTGHARAWSFHIDEATGEKHLHAAWFRIDSETNRAHDPGLFKLRLMEVARWAEKEFGLRELSNQRQPHDKARAPERNEMEESRRLGTDVRAIRTAILDCLERADSGKAFRAALEERGLMLANGDRRDCFVVIDPAGGQHALNKKLTGQTLAETRARLADLDRSQLPGVEQAQAMQRARLAEVQPESSAITVKEPANQNVHTPITPELIAADPWQAVYLDVPKDADRTLLAAVAMCADQCAKFAFAASRVDEVLHPDMAQYSLDRQSDALSRRDEARARLATLPPEQVAKVSPFLHPEQLQDRAMASLAASIGQRYEEMEFRGYATAEAIDQNRWNALTQPLPPHASPELFNRIFETTVILSDEADQRRDAAYTREEADLWDVVTRDLKARRLEIIGAERRQEELVSRAEAWLAKGRYGDLRTVQQEALTTAEQRSGDIRAEMRAAAEEATQPRQPDSREGTNAAAASAAPAEPEIAASTHTAASEPDAVRELAATAEAAVDRAVHAGEGCSRASASCFPASSTGLPTASRRRRP